MRASRGPPPKPTDKSAGDVEPQRLGRVLDVSLGGSIENSSARTIPFDLPLAMRAVKEDKPEMAAMLNQDETKVREVRAQIVSVARKSHILERQLADLEDKIHLLIKNKQNLSEYMTQLDEKRAGDEKQDTGSLAGKRHLYESLFYLLQSKPRYLAKLARLLQRKHVEPFVQSVVFDLYGDQYDSREERLLLQMFRIMIKDELGVSTEKGSLMRANTAVTQMLSAYARRGQGLTALKNILGDPLRNLVKQSSLNLEIKPRSVYTQLISDYETDTGKVSDMDKNIDDIKASEHPEVQKIVAERKELLLNEALTILRRILENAYEIPYGMRWVCKQLSDIAQKRFPDISAAQTTSLMGGYIYLRFFNPAIVNPVDFVNEKPSKKCKRNLVLIAKTLQTLSNGQLFGQKEMYMQCLNHFILENRDPLQDYFQTLILVDDLGEEVAMDRLFDSSHMHNNIVQLSLNNIFLIHELLLEHLDIVAGPADPVREILAKLGPACAQLSRGMDRPITLNLQPPRDSRIATSMSTFGAERVNKIVEQCKRELTQLLLELQPPTEPPKSLMSFLQEQSEALKSPEDEKLRKRVTDVIQLLRYVYLSDLIPKSGTEDESYHNFMMEFVQEALTRTSLVVKTEKRLVVVQQALQSIESHHKSLLGRLELYKMYLDNVRRGQANESQSIAKEKGKKMMTMKPYRVPHTELEQQGIIESCSAPVSKKILKQCFYTFSMVAPGVFKVDFKMGRGSSMSINLLEKPIQLVLEELLALQEAGTRKMVIDTVTLNINLLIHLLNKQFISKT
eukprot:gb/GEZN01001968.1/.p1 GENE.gb/GEZN01001968.1/~~gb/GEZN01001968.1/.p1  ORF type:complete len:792 (+),score=101.82 gb/GEZN01001968.1/:156-2531(+)